MTTQVRGDWGRTVQLVPPAPERSPGGPKHVAPTGMTSVVVGGDLPTSPLYDEMRATTAHRQAEDQAYELYLALGSGDLPAAAKLLQDVAKSITVASTDARAWGGSR